MTVKEKGIKGIIGLMSLGVLGGVALGSSYAFADTLETPVGVQFNAEGHISNPDPDPDALQLRFVPDSVNFGAVNATGNSVTATKELSNNYVALYDGREASETNWKLSAKASNLTNLADSSRTISTGNIEVNVGNTANWTNVNEPTPTNVTGAASSVTNLASSGNVTLPLDGTTSVGIASTSASGSNVGYAVPINSMKLTVTGAAADAGQSYAGTVSWILSDTL